MEIMYQHVTNMPKCANFSHSHLCPSNV